MAGLSIIGIVYGALVAMAQKDMKKLVAYSSVSHLGFVMLGMFALNPPGLNGSILQMINHGLSTGALFLLVGIIYERRHTRMIAEYGGLSKQMPVYATYFLIITMSSKAAGAQRLHRRVHHPGRRVRAQLGVGHLRRSRHRARRGACQDVPARLLRAAREPGEREAPGPRSPRDRLPAADRHPPASDRPSTPSRSSTCSKRPVNASGGARVDKDYAEQPRCRHAADAGGRATAAGGGAAPGGGD